MGHLLARPQDDDEDENDSCYLFYRPSYEERYAGRRRPRRRMINRNQQKQSAVRSFSVIQQQQQQNFPDLGELPPELALTILSYLNPTDLCLAACVWESLGHDELLWQSLCQQDWGYCTVYRRRAENSSSQLSQIPDTDSFSFRRLYLHLDEASLSFNADPFEGMNLLFRRQLVADDPLEIALFFNAAKPLRKEQIRRFLESRPDVLEKLVELKNFKNQFLPNALRKFLGDVKAPEQRNDYLTLLLEKFAGRFIACNPRLGLDRDMVFILCFSLIMLSVDLCSPHVKNKMSKREFIRNTRNAAHANDDFLGDLYDNVYLNGHVAR